MTHRAFSKADQKQLWVPLVEKAYAKAHGGYNAISGGWICEGLFDLTAAPTETIRFGHTTFDAEVLRVTRTLRYYFIYSFEDTNGTKFETVDLELAVTQVIPLHLGHSWTVLHTWVQDFAGSDLLIFNL